MKRFMTTKMAMSILVITVALAMVGMGTFAIFTDTETSAGNQIGAGTLDLLVNGADDPLGAVVNVSNVAPGWNVGAPPNTITVQNAGTIPASQLDVTVNTIKNDDVTCNEPEDAAEVGTGCGTDPGAGELAGNVMVSIVETTGGGSVTIYNGQYSGIVGTTALGALGAGATRTFDVNAWIPVSAGNDIQSDLLIFDVVVSLQQ